MAKFKSNSLPGSRSKLARPESESSTALPKVSNLGGDLKSVSVSAKPPGSSINFGKPSNAGSTTTSSSSNVLTSLLKQTASGGIASALGGGLGGLLGIGSIISDFVHLFGGGGKTAPPPLVQFQAPASRDVVSYVGSGGRTGASSPGLNSSTTNVADGHATGPNYQYQSSQIAQAVKQALLNSNSLNDVIAEI